VSVPARRVMNAFAFNHGEEHRHPRAGLDSYTPPSHGSHTGSALTRIYRFKGFTAQPHVYDL
jgi:hypothetical protein